MPQRVLFLAKSWPVYGGVERWLVDLVVGLDLLGYECTLALAEGNRFHQPQSFFLAYPELANVRVVHLDGTSGSPTGNRLAVARLLHETQPDVVLPVLLADGLVAAAANKDALGYRLIYAVHELCAGVRRDIQAYGDRMDALVFVDESGRAEYRDVCMPHADRIVVLPCGVPPAAFPRQHIASGEIRIGVCGRIEQTQKRVLDVVPICAHLASKGVDFSLKIVGDGSAAGELESALTPLFRLNTLSCSSAVSRDELYNSFYPCIDALLITSEGETGPLVALEAMMNRCLVVTSDFRGRSANALLVSDETCRVFPVGDAAAAAGEIEWAASHRAEMMRIAANGAALAASTRELSSMVRKWNELISQVLALSPVGLGSPAVANVIGSSRLEAIGIPAPLAERIRRLARRKFVHAYPGQEWPHYVQF